MKIKGTIFLLTGATGFIGSCLLRRLVEEKADVHIILRRQAHLWRINDLLKQVGLHYSDLSDWEETYQIMKRVRPDVVYHLSAHGTYSEQNDPDQIILTNFNGSWNLLKAANAVGYKLFVNTGTSSEYGFKLNPMKESTALDPTSYYAVTKAAFTLLCNYVARQEKKPIVTLRPFSVYGPYEQPTRLIPTLMKALYSGEAMKLVKSSIARDFVYIDDIVDAYLRIDDLRRHGGEIFNIGTGKQTTIRQLVMTAIKVTGRKTKLEWGGMPSRSWDTNRWVADINKVRKFLHWRPQKNLPKGLRLTWDWFRNAGDIYKKCTGL